MTRDEALEKAWKEYRDVGFDNRVSFAAGFRYGIRYYERHVVGKKLPPVETILGLLKSGMSLRDVGKKYNVRHGAVWQAVKDDPRYREWRQGHGN